MPHDPYESCYGCPKPRPCDRSACDGWQSREAKKELRYKQSAIHSANYDTYNPQKERILRRAHIPLKGYGQ